MDSPYMNLVTAVHGMPTLDLVDLDAKIKAIVEARAKLDEVNLPGQAEATEFEGLSKEVTPPVKAQKERLKAVEDTAKEAIREAKKQYEWKLRESENPLLNRTQRAMLAQRALLLKEELDHVTRAQELKVNMAKGAVASADAFEFKRARFEELRKKFK